MQISRRGGARLVLDPEEEALYMQIIGQAGGAWFAEGTARAGQGLTCPAEGGGAKSGRPPR